MLSFLNRWKRQEHSRRRKNGTTALQLGVEQLECRLLLTPVLVVTDELITSGFNGIYSHGWADGEDVDYDIQYSDGSTESIGGDRAGYLGFSEENEIFGSGDPLGVVTITATGEFGGVVTAQSTLVVSHSGTFSELNVIGPGEMIIGESHRIYTEGWLPDEKVTYTVTWPDGEIDSGWD